MVLISVQYLLMSLLTATRKLVSEITSPDAFEALATAVLREADPSYAALIHVGTNVEGRTVRSPVDGIGLSVYRGSRRLLVVQHTITATHGLRRKWLAPEEGDLAKAKAIISAERIRGVVREAILVLCSTTDPNEKLIRDVYATVGEGLKVDIWPGSRLADFLDRDPEGQWLRQSQFGTDAVRLSASQARTVALRSLDNYLPLVDREDIVSRVLDLELSEFTRDVRGAGFVVGESGLGKSAALRRLGDRWLADGGIAIVLDHEMIEQSATVDQAITLGLRKWAPSLDVSCGQVALSFTTAERPLLLIVEDVNRSANPHRIVERLISWSGTGDSRVAAAEWRLLCPLWRGNAGTADSQLRGHVFNRSLLVDRFEHSEAVEAILIRSRAVGVALTKLQAIDLAAALGNDPLLIGLNTNWATPGPRNAIHSYVAENMEGAADGRLLVSDLRSALEFLVERMVEARVVSPSWDQIRMWFAGDGDGLAGIRRLVDQGKIVRLGTDDRLAYRHDRVRDHLLVHAIVRLIGAGRFTSDLWAEPFYAGLIGGALTVLPPECVDQAGTHNPVSVFAALQDPTVDQEHRTRLLAAARQWLASSTFNDDMDESLRSHALWYLMRTDGAFVEDLVQPFRHSFWKLEALARNGRAEAAAALCGASGPGVRNSWLDEIIAHALACQLHFVDDVAALLLKPELAARNLEGILNLAGEIGDPRLCDALASRWEEAGGGAALSSGWLWAVLRCCTPVGHPLADEVCRVWADLPSKVSRKSDKPDGHTRWDIAGYSLPWGLGRKSSPATLAFLIDLPKRHKGLSHIVHTIISHIDDPEAVLWTVKASASVDRRIQGKDRINFTRFHLDRHWSPEQRGRTLSRASRVALEALWRNKRISRFDRSTAFRIWCLTPTANEFTCLSALEGDSVLADQALRTRLAAGDQTAVRLLSDRLQAGDRSWVWWYQARKVGIGGLEAEVRRFFEERRRNPHEIVDSWSDAIMAELLMDSRSAFAIATIVENWDQLQASSIFVQAALYLAAPETIALGQAAVTASENPHRMLNHIGMHWGIKVAGRPGVTALAQLQALEPFLTVIGDGQYGQMHLGELFEAANRLRELVWRKDHLDPLLRANGFDYCPSDRGVLYASLDGEVQRASKFNRTWFEVKHWFERREEEQWDRGALLGFITDWAVDRESEPAVRLLCDALAQFGERLDLALFNRIPTTLSQACATPIACCIYDVRRRSL
jgi:hypothetical protein